MSLTRRRFLIGLGGAVVALPLLPSLDWTRRGPGARRAGVARADDGVPHGLVVVRAGNGVQQQSGSEPEHFWPAATGALTTAILGGASNADRATSELAAYASKLSILKGMNRPFGTPACGHSESLPQVLTAQQNTGGDGNMPLALGQSIDWRIVNQLAPGHDPMTLMAGPSSAYIGEALSWRASGERTSAERSPRNQYMRMMGISGMPPEIQTRIVARRTSVNDLVRTQLRDLLGKAQLSTHDKGRLQQHLDAVRDTELHVMSCDADPAMVAAIGAIDDPEATDVRPEVVKLHMELVALAFSCGFTRSATIQVGEGNDQTEYTIDGTLLPRFHWISHRIYSDGSDGAPIPQAVELHAKVDRLQLQMFAHLLQKLDAIASPIAGRTLLDDSVAVWTNDLAAGPSHGGQDVPWLLAGSAGTALRTGQYLDLGGVTTNKLLSTLLTAVGCTKTDGSPVDDFGDASLERGLIPELLA